MVQADLEQVFQEHWPSARQGDARARAALFESIRARLISFLERKMGAQARRKSAVEDLVQNAFLDLHRRMERFPEDLDAQEFLSYALQMARWRLGDLMRRPEPTVGISELPAEKDRGASETGIVTREDERRFCREQLEQLEESDRVILEAFHLRGLTVAEIAADLGVERNAVKQRLVRGRRRLRELIMKGRSEF